MATDFDFSLAQFLWVVFVFVGVPSAVGIVFVRTALWSERRRLKSGADDRRGAESGTWRGNRGLWATGAIGFGFGFIACAGWLTWTAADAGGRFRGPALPAPTQFPTWQVVACGLTVVLGCTVAAHLSRWALSGGMAAAVGTAAGFSTAFSVEASTDVTGQSGVGIILAELGWGLCLGLLMFVRGNWLNRFRDGEPLRITQL